MLVCFILISGIKHLVTFYGFDVNYLPQMDPSWSQRYQELFAQCDRVLCEGPHMAGCLVGLGCPESKVRVQHLGVRRREQHPQRSGCPI